MTHAGVENAFCSVCGESIGTKKSIAAPKGKRVCETCVENARQVLAAREARKHRRAAEAKTQAELARVEGDNRIVLELQEDEWLRAAAHSCPNCARYLALSDQVCPHCAYGAPAGTGKKSRIGVKIPRGGGKIVRASTGPLDDVLGEVHPQLPVIVPFVTLAPALIGLALAWRIPWLWNTAIMTLLVVGVFVVAGCAILLAQQKSRLFPVWLGCTLVLCAAAIAAARLTQLQLVATAAAIASLTFGGMWFMANRERLDLSLRISLALLGLTTLVVAAYLLSKHSA